MEYIFVSPLMLMSEQENLFSRYFRSFPFIQLGVGPSAGSGQGGSDGGCRAAFGVVTGLSPWVWGAGHDGVSVAVGIQVTMELMFGRA